MVSRSLGDRFSWWLTIPHRALSPESPSLFLTIRSRLAIRPGLPFNSEIGFPIFLLTFSSGATPSFERFLTASLRQTEKLKFRNTTTNVVVIKIVFVVPEKTEGVSAEWRAAPAKLLQKSHHILYIQKWRWFFHLWLLCFYLMLNADIQEMKSITELFRDAPEPSLWHYF